MFAGLAAGALVFFTNMRPSLPKRHHPVKETSGVNWSGPLLIQYCATLGSKKLSLNMELLELSPPDVAKKRGIYAGVAFGAAVLLAIIAPLPFIGKILLVLLLPVGGFFFPTVSVNGDATEFKRELTQALSQLFSFMQMALETSQAAEAAKYAAEASDHRTFLQFRKLIPPPNSKTKFGEALFNFAERHGMNDIANRAAILQAADSEIGAPLQQSIAEQAKSCRDSFVSATEEEMTRRTQLADVIPTMSVSIIMVFIMYAIFNSFSNLDLDSIGEDPEEAETE